jgi:AraC-like DNA-binding protein
MLWAMFRLPDPHRAPGRAPGRVPVSPSGADPAAAALLAELCRLLARHAPVDGVHDTAIPGVAAVRASHPGDEIAHALHHAALCLIAQGAKRVMLGEEVYVYDASRYLVFSVDLPIGAQVMHATPDEPYLCFRLDLPAQVVADVMLKTAPAAPLAAPSAAPPAAPPAARPDESAAALTAAARAASSGASLAGSAGTSAATSAATSPTASPTASAAGSGGESSAGSAAAGAPPAPPVPVARGLYLSRTGPPLLDAVVRLLRLLDAPDDAAALAPLVQQEIIYRLLRSEEGARLARVARADSQAHRVARAIAWLKTHYAEPLRVEALAQHVHMSASSLHHHFRAVTAMSPLQYQKQLRLQEARRLLLGEVSDAASAGHRVGYESPSQFSREYARLFGMPPARDAQRMREQRSSVQPVV